MSEIAKKDSALVVPSFLGEAKTTGFEGLDSGAQALPFLKVLQPQSNEIMEEHEDYIKGAKPGMFYNSLTRQLYGKSIELILVYSERMYIEWKTEMGGFVSSMRPSEAEGQIIDKRDYPLKNIEGNDLVETISFYCLVADKIDEGPIIFSCSGTMLGITKRFISRLRITKLSDGKTPAPSYAYVYKFSTEMNTNDKGTWYNIGKGKTDRIERGRYITEDEFKATMEAYDIVADKGIDYSKADVVAENFDENDAF